MIPKTHTQIGAIDCNFIKKNGKNTYDLDEFYSSKLDNIFKGLEISTIFIVDVDGHTAYNIFTYQSPVIKDPNKTRMDWYVEHFHFNASRTVLNGIKIQDRQSAEKFEGRVISVLSWNIRKFKEDLLERLSIMSGLNLTLIKSKPEYQNLN